MRNLIAKMNRWLRRFMQGRNGMDQMGRGLYRTAILLLVLTLLTGSGLLNLLTICTLGYTIFRMVSSNVDARHRENARYLTFTDTLRRRIGESRGLPLGQRLKSLMPKGLPDSLRMGADRLKTAARQKKLRFDERKEYRFFKCSCGATLRCKRGRGTRELICPVCKQHMTRNTD